MGARVVAITSSAEKIERVKALESLAFGGFVGIVGFFGGMETKLPIVPLIEKMLRVDGVPIGSRNQFEEMNRTIEASGLKPVIDQVMPMKKAGEAFKLMDRGGHFRKVVLTI